MRATTVTVGPLVAASANNIALSQTPSAAFTLNGSLVTSGVAILDTSRRVLLTQAASESGKSYTIVGTSDGTTPQTEILAAAASATTVQSALDFKTVSSIRISSAATGAITIGTSGVASSRWVRLDEWIGESIAIQCTVTGTVNYSVQGTMQDPTSPTNPVAAYSAVWTDIDDTTIVGATATQSGVTSALPVWLRVLLNSGTGSVSTVLSQASQGGGGGGSGGGSGSSTATATAAANGTVAVSAGTNKPQAIDLFSSTSVQIKDATGTAFGTAGNPFSTGPTATAAASGTVAVSAGTNKPQAVDLFSSTSVLIKDSTGNVLDYTLPSAVIGATAADAALTQPPVTVGGLAKTAYPTAVSDGDVVNTLHDKLGKQVVIGAIRVLKEVQVTTITSSTSETTIATAVASTFLDLYGLIIANSSATATLVTIKDATAGTTRAVFYVPAGDTRGFMLDPGAAIAQATVNNNWTATCGTSVASINITALTVQNL